MYCSKCGRRQRTWEGQPGPTVTRRRAPFGDVLVGTDLSSQVTLSVEVGCMKLR